MLDRLKGGDWVFAFECCGIESDEVRKTACEYPPYSRYNEPKVSCVHGWSGDASGFTRDDVAEILAIEDGENDGANWIGFFLLKDGRYAFLSAGCDYTGWDCQSGGHAIVGPDKDTMLRLGIGKEDLERLNLARPAEVSP